MKITIEATLGELAALGMQKRAELARLIQSAVAPVVGSTPITAECVEAYAYHLRPIRSDAQIVEETERLARSLLSWRWGAMPEDSGAQMRHSGNTKAQNCWGVACRIQAMLTQTDVENAVEAVDDALLQTKPASAPSQPAPAVPVAKIAAAATARSASTADAAAMIEQGYMRSASDGWLSLTPAGQAVLSLSGYAFDSQKGWQLKAEGARTALNQASGQERPRPKVR